MRTPRSFLPDLPTLTARLASALNLNGEAKPPLSILERSLPQMMSTFPNETIVCRLPNGRKQRLFVKYEAGQRHVSFGHRGGVAYEAKVYDRILRRYPGFRPRRLGAHTDQKTGETWLILEYVDRCVRVSDIIVKQDIRQPLAMNAAARWIGRFHAAHEGSDLRAVPSFLKRYDARYYRGWCRRTAEFTRPLHRRFPWLPELCALENEWLALLLPASPTLIHGEYYAKTVLLRNRSIFPLDWESAALAPGEIDLAALTEGEGWPEKIVSLSERAYRRARWPEGAPAHFQQTLEAARIYLHFRWLGERPDWTIREKSFWRYDHLRAAAERLGLLSRLRPAPGPQ